MSEEAAEGMIARAEEMVTEGLIEGFTVQRSNVRGRGGEIWADYEITLLNYCVGAPVFVKSVAVWFAWRGIGRALLVTKEVGVELRALDPVSYIFTGRRVEPQLVELVFPFPSTIEAAETTRPTIEITMRLPSGNVYTFSGFDMRGWITIRPERTFILTIKDNKGGLKLENGKLRMQALIHYYYTREYQIPPNGSMRIWRLPDEFTYRVTVTYNSTYSGEVTVLDGHFTALDMARSGELRTDLYTLRITPLDRGGRPLDGAEAYLDGHLELSRGGEAIFHLVPRGNHSIAVRWRGVEVLRDYLWVGYHPTLNPLAFVPDRISLETDVASLIIQATDAEGRPVGALFSVEGAGNETSIEGFYSGDGLLILEQMPDIEYRVVALDRSLLFGGSAVAEGVYRPAEGTIQRIVLPLYKLELRIVARTGEELAGASIKIVNAHAETDGRGIAAFSDVPTGSYEVEVRFMNLTVYRGALQIERETVLEIPVEVFSLDSYFVDKEGRATIVEWGLAGRVAARSGLGDRMRIEPLPNDEYDLSVRYRGQLIVKRVVRLSEISGTNITLPLAPMRVAAYWSSGAPLEEGLVRAEGEHFSAEIEIRVGEGASRYPLPFGSYRLALYHATGGYVLRSQTVMHSGDPIALSAELGNVSVVVTDLLDRGVEGALVEVIIDSSPASKTLTSSDGTAILRDIPIPEKGGLRVRASYGAVQGEAVVSAGGEGRVKLGLVILMGRAFTTVDLSLIGAGVGGVLVAAVAAAALRIAKRRSRGGRSRRSGRRPHYR